MSKGFLLHSRPYRETSSLLVFFSDTHGRMDAVARSTRVSGKKRQASPLLFSAYDLAWSGKGELKQLVHCEPIQPSFQLQEKSLYCGFYVNEILYHLLPKNELEEELFQVYLSTLHDLACSDDIEPCLRVFELAVLRAIGYGISLAYDSLGMRVDPCALYCYVPEHGLQQMPVSISGPIVSGMGEHFLAIDAGDYQAVEVRRLAKSLLRRVLNFYLGSKSLHSREFFSPL